MIAAPHYVDRCQRDSDIRDHMPRLHREASRGDATIIELGVRTGNSTAAFLAAVEEHGGSVWSVDIDYPRVPWTAHPQWLFILGDDLLVVDDLPAEADVVFIDTSHHYSQTLAELAAYVPKVKPGGVVLLHDTELADPVGAPAGDPRFPVRVAVEQYCEAHGLTPQFVSGCNGLGVIRIPEVDE